MATWKVIFALILLAVRVQHVACRTGSLFVDMDTSSAPLFQVMSPPLPQSKNEDPCQNRIVSCNPAASLGPRIVIWVSAVISFSLLFFPICRIIGLQPGHSQDSTLFWWFLCIGSAGNAVWWSYFSACFYGEASVLPILLANISGAIVNVALTLVATCRTTTLGDSRHYLSIPVPTLCFMAAYGMKHRLPVEYTGWFGLALTGLSQSFRVASSLSSYGGDFNGWQFAASVMGSVGGCLWTIHPQLCVSREYKITSYVVAIIRGTEAVIWSSPAIARQLRRFEGRNVVPLPPHGQELQMVV